MRVKHCKLIASVVVLVSLLALPLTNVARVIESTPVSEVVPYVKQCPTEYQYDPLAGKKEYIHTLLKYVYNVDPNHIDWWTFHIAESSALYSVSEDHMIAILAVESKFNPFPKRKNGLVGPMQVKAKYWKNNGKYNIYNPDENVMLGAEILRSYKDECGNWDCALKSYNVGIGAHLKGESRSQQKIYMKLINRELALIERNKKRG